MVKINLLFMLLLATLSSFSQLTVIENYFDGQGGIEGLESPTDMEIDSSGNMYIVGNSSYLHLFMHENAEYANFVELQNATINHDLGNVDEIKSTPDHRFFYLTGDNKLQIFTRKEGQDRLMHLKTIENNTDLELGYAVFTDLSISQDGKNLYLAREVANLQNSLMVFSIDSLSGDITLRNKITDVQNINNIICNNQFVYTTSRGDSENSIRVYQRTNDNNIVLVQKINAADSISQIKSITLSADNRFLYVSDQNSVMVFEGQTDGKLVLIDKIMIADFYSPFWNESILLASPDNQNLYFTDFMGVIVFKRDIATGKLTHIQTIQGDSDFKMFYNITAIKISQDGAKIFVVSRSNDSIVLFDRDKTTGKISFSGKILNEQKKIRGLVDIVDIQISKNDKFLYTLGESGTNTIGLYKRLNTGKLEFDRNITWYELGTEIGAVKDFQLSPDNKSMYISSTNMYGIRIMNRDTTTGDLSFYKSYTIEGTGLSDEIISEFVIPNDGKDLYAATFNNLVHYKIDQQKSDLQFVESITSDGNTGNGLPGFKKIIASNDNKNIYVFSSSMFTTSGISVYKRDNDGNLELVEKLLNTDYPFMVESPFSLALSPDDKYLYAAGTSILFFKRNLETGKLNFEFEIKYEELDLGNLYRISNITINRDGKYLLAVSNENKIALSFYRSVTNGKLKLKQTTHFSTDNNYSNGDPFSVFSNDMKTAYIASPYDGTLGVYEASIPLSLNKITDFCKGDTATISVDEGYNYLWSDGSTQNFMTTTTPGEHTVQVTDDTGRKGADTTSVVFHDPPEFMLLKEEWNSNDNTSLINAFSYDYTSPFTYLWNDGSTSQSIIVSNPDSLNPKKEFSVTVTDKYGCYNSESISLIYTALHDDYLKNDDGISIFPNPFNENIHFDIQKPNYGNLKVRVSNLEGKELLKFNLNGTKNSSLNLSSLLPGIYILEVTDNKLIKREKILKLK